METLFITGVTGYIGGSVAARLVKAGYRVRGLVRSQNAAQLLAARNIEPVIGSLDDADLLSREAAAADGVINAASADHAASVAALIEGLQGTSKLLLHTSGSSVIADDARGSRPSDIVFSDDLPLIVHPAKQARRNIDLMVLNSAGRNIRSVVVCPGLVYGVGRGLNRHSYQVPFLASNARQQGIVQVVGAGKNIWSNVHIDDLTELYLLALRKAPASAFYFAENGEETFLRLGEAIAKRLQLSGVEQLQPSIAAASWGELKAYFSLGSNSRVRSTRSRRELDWTPNHASITDWVISEMPDDDFTVSQI